MHRISDDDAQALVKGHAPVARPELAHLAGSMSEFRSAAFETVPRPSAELASRLDLARASRISTLDMAVSDSDMVQTQSVAASEAGSHKKGAKNLISWFVGLGLGTKIVLGATVAVAATTGAGAAGALPDGAQDAFDKVVSVVSSTEEPETDTTAVVDDTEEPTVAVTPETSSFGESVSDRAQELGQGSDGSEFGEEISEEAQQLGDEKRQDAGQPEGTVDDGAADDGEVTDAPAVKGPPADSPGAGRND